MPSDFAAYLPHVIVDDEDNERAIAFLEGIDALAAPTADQIALAETVTQFVVKFEERYAFPCPELEGLSDSGEASP